MIQHIYRFKYRSTCGTDVSDEADIPKGKTREEAIRDEIADMKDSITPLVEIDGKPIDISEFLNRQIALQEEDVARAVAQLAALKKEKQRREKILKEFKKKSKKKL